MKIYLVLEYKKESGNVWAEVTAFTSKSERYYAFQDLKVKNPQADAEEQDVEVTKRPYSKKETVDEQPESNS